MATAVQTVPERFRPFEWLEDFLRDELAPFPGRGVLVARMVIAVTIIVIVNMTLRIPYGAYGAIWALAIPRDNPEATIRAVRTLVISFSCSAGVVLIGSIFFSGDPLLRTIWVGGTLCGVFYVLSALSNYTAAARFGYIIVITVPVWDQQIPAELKVEDTLWAVGAISLAGVITAIVEVIFHKLKPLDDLSESIDERLEQVQALLNSYADGTPDQLSEKQIRRLSMLGTSRMRGDLQRSGYTPQYAEKMSAVVAYIGRLVDLAANLTYFAPDVPATCRRRILRLVAAIENIRIDLLNRRVPHVQGPLGGEAVEMIPLLVEMEVTVSLIPDLYMDTQDLQEFTPSSMPAETRKGLFVPDALSNSRHAYFALRGGLAAFLCYAIYNLIAWPGISTAVTTCYLTALTTIGASRQKQALRFSGALVGGAIALLSQVFVLPLLDSITGFLLPFVVITIASAWFVTSGPRLSYFGIQFIVPFCLLNLEEFKFQPSLELARDRVVGVLLGLLAMWLVFDQLCGTSAATEMEKVFVSNIRLLAQLTREPLSIDRKAAIEMSYSLRETINANFDQLRQHPDAVLLEFGSSRAHKLAIRSKGRRWEYPLRMIFIARIALLKYRLQLPGFELPTPMQAVQQEFDMGQAALLEAMADRLTGEKAHAVEFLKVSSHDLQKIVRDCYPVDPPKPLLSQLRTFLLLSEHVDALIDSLNQEI